MQALVFNGPGQKRLEDRPKPAVNLPSDAIVKITRTTTCGTDLHILKGDVPACKPGTILGHEGVGVVDSVGSGVTSQAEFVPIAHADTSLYPIPAGADEEALVMLSDILPTGFECGVLNGKVQPGSSVAIVGSTDTVNSNGGDAAAKVMALTQGRGVGVDPDAAGYRAGQAHRCDKADHAPLQAGRNPRRL
jgi:threonine dehydrogenase-like Zn-dependent dehydrogenase